MMKKLSSPVAKIAAFCVTEGVGTTKKAESLLKKKVVLQVNAPLLSWMLVLLL